MKSVNIIVAKF